MQKIDIEVKNKTGLHARPASIFVKETLKYKSDIKVVKNNKEYNAKSIISVLGMSASMGDTITLLISGDDEKKAVDALKELFESGFGE
ncbi:MAG: hypothetical protein APF77_23615 [Clostridia bacterium BRH_c25]|nr:MAG: hypothetical protein APF77_23615 [Clostridia bacterium BRH_c25]